MTTNMTDKAKRTVMLTMVRDAYLLGDESLAVSILAESAMVLNRTQVKQMARFLVAHDMIMLATKILTKLMPLSSALAEMAPAPVPTVGTILVTSWGYDQTNVDFYEITAVKGSTAKLRQIAGRCAESVARGSNYVVAAPGVFIGAETTHRIGKSYDGSLSIKVDDRHASVWNGEPSYQTASGNGH